MMESPGSRRRIVLPLSRVILIFIVGAISLFRGILTIVESSKSGAVINRSIVILYLVLGIILLIVGALLMIMHFRARRKN